MGLFDLLAQFLQYLVSWVPRPILVPEFMACVRWTLGRQPELVTAWGIEIPLIHHIERCDLRWDATEYEPKILWTKDGHEVALGMVIMWKITDPLLCASSVNDLHAFAQEIGESILPEIVGRYTLAEFKSKAAGGEEGQWALNTHLTRNAKKLFSQYGVEIDYARVNFTSDRVRTLKHIGSALGAHTA